MVSGSSEKMPQDVREVVLLVLVLLVLVYLLCVWTAVLLLVCSPAHALTKTHIQAQTYRCTWWVGQTRQMVGGKD